MNRIEYIQRTARVASHAQAFSNRELYEMRLHQGVPKAALKAVYARVVGSLVAREIEVGGEGYHLMSGGSEQIVYGGDERVAKVVVGSLSFDRSDAEQYADRLRRDYDTVEPYLGEHITETVHDIKRFRGGLFAALVLQPRLRATKEFLNVEEMIMYSDDEAYMNQLRSLFESLTKLYESEGLQMDLNGRNNIFLMHPQGAPNIRIVDSIVVTPELQAVVDRALNITNGQTLLAQVAKLREHLDVLPNPAS